MLKLKPEAAPAISFCWCVWSHEEGTPQLVHPTVHLTPGEIPVIVDHSYVTRQEAFEHLRKLAEHTTEPMGEEVEWVLCRRAIVPLETHTTKGVLHG